MHKTKGFLANEGTTNVSTVPSSSRRVRRLCVWKLFHNFISYSTYFI